ncbi:MAG TPA: type III-A CRISPR-associated RAMP protein Csm4 [Anaerolinea thermolimosa]|uniref:CRISPR system Cms protein Csm4 n=1 Tax=Anaerolinea thermolimosa TaxID=229919 RepID=A0A3D1JJ61_9CHLR|nr:type III-A CRISPR-associated RAMP protein Csm4 [Anaerolinea thermolimosa]GAP05377.1 CRISPR-associated protein, Csm4 family [Anaerolinea thermolimosa]HCE18265.1 type III-A CRISPR-associated RAMP protein Csm4 [Anaerolinea thermolimosa]
MRLEIWSIHGSGFHFGRHGLGQEETDIRLPSDSLFAALTSCMVRLEGPTAVSRWGEAFLQDPPVAVFSSAFPRAGGVLLFPTPLRIPATRQKDEVIPLKTLKRVRFVSPGLFRRLLGGESLADLYPSALALQDGQVLLSAEERGQLPEAVLKDDRGRLWSVEQRPRVTVGREWHNSNLFFTGRCVFMPECGLWFGVRWLREDPSMRALLPRLMQELGDSGLGGDRTSGMGRARMEAMGTCDLPDPVPGAPWMTLSRYLPAEGEMTALRDERAAYSIESVGGWAESPGKKAERRRTVRMLSEGSVLGPLEAPAPGVVADVQPDYNGTRPLGHAVWRWGRALAVGFTAGVLDGR